MTEERKTEGTEDDKEEQKPERIVHKLEFDEASFPRKRRKKKKYRKKGLYRKKSTLRRKVKKRWLNNRRNLKQLAAITFVLLPLLIIILIILDSKFKFIPWHYLNFLWERNNS